MEFFEYYCKKFSIILTDLAAAALVVLGVWGGVGNSVGMVCFHVFKAVICIVLAVRILWSNHGGAICERGVEFLLWPRRFLKKAPPPLSQARALMARGEWVQAGKLLARWHEEYPESANIALAYFGLLADHFHRYEEALKIASETFECRLRSREEAAVQLLGRTTDLLCTGGYRQKAIELLEQESGRNGLYAPEQLRNIRQRELAMKKGI